MNLFGWLWRHFTSPWAETESSDDVAGSPSQDFLDTSWRMHGASSFTEDDSLSRSDIFSDDDLSRCSSNPATGLPMLGGCGGFDIAGNSYGFDMGSSLFDHDSSTFDDTWNDTFSPSHGFGGMHDD